MPVEKNRLKITEIFFSLQGESKTVGIPTIFIRLTGCPLRCVYCDTAYAFSGGEWMSYDRIVEKVQSYKTNHITVTGGEPLAQAGCHDLLRRLCDLGYQVSIETSGALSIKDIDPRVSKVMDLKTPASGEEDRNLLENIGYLKDSDEVKFVICDEDDYLWSKALIDEYQIGHKCSVLFSPSFDQQSASQLAEWILRDGLNVRFQLQLHKYLWGNAQGK